MPEMWTCPKCDRSFANPNQWHSCIWMALDEHLAAKTGHAVDLYRAVEGALRDCGEFRIHPQKTRVAFIARMTFAGVSLARRWADLSVILPEPVGDERMRRIELYGPTSFGHHLRLASLADVDDDVRRWLCEAHRRGEQETLDPASRVEPVVGVALERLLVPLRSKVVAGPDGPALTAPRYAVDAFHANPAVLARVSGDTYPGTLVASGLLVLAPGAIGTLGFGEGDAVDVFLTADA